MTPDQDKVLSEDTKEKTQGLINENKETLREIGIKEGLTGQLLEDYITFFNLRFGKHSMYGGYPNEWAQRFLDGREWGAADLQSRRCLIETNPDKYGKQTYNIEIECSKYQFMALMQYVDGLGIEYDMGTPPKERVKQNLDDEQRAREAEEISPEDPETAADYYDKHIKGAK